MKGLKAHDQFHILKVIPMTTKHKTKGYGIIFKQECKEWMVCYNNEVPHGEECRYLKFFHFGLVKAYAFILSTTPSFTIEKSQIFFFKLGKI